MNYKFIGGAALLALVVIGFIGYRGWLTDSGAQTAAAGASGTERIRIGVIAPTTGPFPDWGESIQNGVRLAIEDTKHAIDVEYQDDACDPKQSIGVAKKFTDNGIRVIVMGCDDGIKAALPLLKEKGLVVLSASFLGDNTFDENPTNLINLSTQISTEAETMAAYMKARGVQSVAIIHSQNIFGEEVSHRLPEKLSARGMRVTTIEATPLDVTDFRTTISRVLQTKPDAIYILHSGEQIGMLSRQLRVVNKTIPLYAYYGIEADNALNAGGATLEEVHYTYPVNIADGTEGKTQFDKRYAEAFPGRIPTATSYFMYDGIMLLDKALDECSWNDGACIENFFKNYGTYNGLSGEMTVQKDGKNVRPFGIKVIENGEFRWVTKEVTL